MGGSQDLPKTVVVEPVSTGNPGVYFARVVSDVYVKTGQDYRRLSDAHRSSLIGSTGEKEPEGVNEKSHGDSGKEGVSQGVPDVRGDVRAVVSPGSLDDRGNVQGAEPCYCLIEMINTSASPVELGKNVKIEEGEPLEFRRGET